MPLPAGTPITSSDGTPILCGDNATPAVANGVDDTGCCTPVGQCSGPCGVSQPSATVSGVSGTSGTLGPCTDMNGAYAFVVFTNEPGIGCTWEWGRVDPSIPSPPPPAGGFHLSINYNTSTGKYSVNLHSGTDTCTFCVWANNDASLSCVGAKLTGTVILPIASTNPPGQCSGSATVVFG